MNIYIANSLEEKIRGVEFLSEKEFENACMVFTDVGESAYFNMENVNYSIYIMALGQEDEILDIGYMEPKTGKYRTPKGTKNVVEVGCNVIDKFQVGDIFYLQLKKID